MKDSLITTMAVTFGQFDINAANDRKMVQRNLFLWYAASTGFFILLIAPNILLAIIAEIYCDMKDDSTGDCSALVELYDAALASASSPCESKETHFEEVFLSNLSAHVMSKKWQRPETQDAANPKVR